MSFDKVFEKVRHVLENADARHVFEHVAVQVNVVGETEKCFYIEIANRSVSVEPYDYHDKDALIRISEQDLVDICDGKCSLHESRESGKMVITGDLAKIDLLKTIVDFD